jgi:hypothetical protein
MAGKRAEPRSDEGLQTGTPAQHDERTDGVEHTGPLVVERLRKGDGRALILYSTAAEHE